MDATQLFVVVRTLGAEPELLAAFDNNITARAMAAALGEGHQVAPVRLLGSDGMFVAHVWECKAEVTTERYIVGEPARLRGASRIVADTDDMPGERVHVDEAAGELEAQVHGQTVTYIRAYAPSAKRAKELAEGKAQELREPES